MCEQRTGLASPPDSRSRRQFLRTVGVAGVSIVAAGRTAAGDGPPPDGNAGTLAKVTSQTDRALWRFETGDWVSASPTVIDGTVYVGSDDAHLYALDAATGSQEWRYETATPVDRAPAVRPEAQSQFEGAGVFFGDHKHFYAVDGATGEKRWDREKSSVSSPVLTEETVLFFGSTLNRIRTGDGSKEWEARRYGTRLDGSTFLSRSGSPTVVDGTVYITTVDGFTAVSPDTGQTEWGHILRTPIRSSPTVHDSRVVAGDMDGTLYAVTEEGVVWRFSAPSEAITSSPTISDDTVFVGSGDGNVYAVDAGNGEEVWRFETGSNVHSSPTVADGTVFVGSEDGHVYAIDAGSGEESWRFDAGDPVRSSPTVVDGVLFVGGWDGNVYALDAGTSGSSAGTRIDQGVLGHHHSHVGADKQSIDPIEEFTVQTPPGGVSDANGDIGLSSSDVGPGFGVGTALAGLGAGALWVRRRLRND